jgi:hypothetical protein
VDLWNVKEKQFSFSAYHIRRKDDWEGYAIKMQTDFQSARATILWKCPLPWPSMGYD